MRLFALVLLVNSAAACEPRRGPHDEAAVWDIALVYEVRGEQGARGTYVVLQDRTTLGPLHDGADAIAARFRAENIEIPSTLIQRFLEANGAPMNLTGAFRDSHRVGTVGTARMRELFSGPDLDTAWVSFYRTFSGAAGLFEISRPGFYRDLALVHVFMSCGGTCGRGRFFVLQATHGTWVLRNVVTTGVS
jgi:hypothetical protein